MAEDYIPFEKALEELKMSESELKRLISEDEIQAVRDEDGSIRLKKTDVEALAKSSEEIAEELVFADEEDETGMVTAVLEDDGLLEEEETLEIEPETLEVEEDEPKRAPAAGRGRRTHAPAPAAVRGRSRAAALRGTGGPKEGEEATWERVATIVTAVLLVYGLFVSWSIAESQTTGLTAWLADLFAK